MLQYFYVYPFAEVGQKDPVPTDDTIDDSMSYHEGFTVNYEYELGVNPDAIPIPRGQSNQLYYSITDNLRQYQTESVPQWITAADNNPGGVPTPFAYPLFARVRYDDGSGMKVYENQVDGNTDTPGVSVLTWIVVSGNAQGVPPGTIIEWGGDTPPAGYLLCNGDLISRTTYANLFAEIGTFWGVGDGSTTFALPDLRGRVSMGAGGSVIIIDGITIIGNDVGDIGGSAGVVLTQGQLAQHNHGISFTNTLLPVSSAGSNQAMLLLTPSQTANTGNNEAHANIQPSAIVTKCIKY